MQSYFILHQANMKKYISLLGLLVATTGFAQNVWVNNGRYTSIVQDSIIVFDEFSPRFGNMRTAKWCREVMIDSSGSNQLKVTEGATTTIFRPLAERYTDSIRFEKLYFEATACYGFCPEFKITIDSIGLVQINGGKYAAIQGAYTTTLAPALLQQLVTLLKIAELDKIIGNDLKNIDSPTYTFTIHYNGKSVQLTSSVPPLVTEPLRKWLMALPALLK